MNHQSADIKRLFLKYANGTASKVDVQELLELLKLGNDDQDILAMLQEQLTATEPVVDLNRSRWENVLGQIQSRIHTEPKRLRLWPRIAVAAAMIAVVGFGGYFLLSNQQATLRDAADIVPGNVGATLTLSSGKQIKMADADNGELANEAGISVVKTADGQLVYQVRSEDGDPCKMNKLTTGMGQTYMLILPDKSRVWMNTASSLSYATAPAKNGERKVRLEGEAYFEITKDKAHPFIVETNRQKIQVLGTHFNVNNYADEPLVSVTLLEGSVSVAAVGNRPSPDVPEETAAVILKPGQQALNRKGDIEVVQADLEQIMDWKQGDFYLNRVNFKTAMRKIARWYNVEVVYDASVSDAIESGGWISRNKKLSEVLQSIEASGQVHFKVEGRKVIVSK